MGDIVGENSTFAFVSNLSVNCLYLGGNFGKWPPAAKKMKISDGPISNFLRKIPIYVCSKFGAFLNSLNNFRAKPLHYKKIQDLSLFSSICWIFSHILYLSPMNIKFSPTHRDIGELER